jgi:hypothetical protein
MMPPVRICAVIVNFRTARLTLGCVASLRPQLSRPHDHVYVVDNASGGNEVQVLHEHVRAEGLSDLVTIIAHDVNGGFSAGNNVVLQTVSASYYLLANSDTLFRPGAVAALLEAAARHPDAAVIGPQLENRDGSVLVSCFRFPRPLSETIRSADTSVVTRLLSRYVIPLPVADLPSMPEWTSFAAVLIPGSALQRIGLLDPGYFMYFEDTDYCRRASAAGFAVLHWPKARVVHLEGQSAGAGDPARRGRRPSYYYMSRARYYTSAFGCAGLACANLCWLIGRPLSFLRELLAGRAAAVPRGECIQIWRRARRGARGRMTDQHRSGGGNT